MLLIKLCRFGNFFFFFTKSIYPVGSLEVPSQNCCLKCMQELRVAGTYTHLNPHRLTYAQHIAQASTPDEWLKAVTLSDHCKIFSVKY